MVEHQRTIKSFVIREGRMSASQKQLLEKLWPKYGLDLTDIVYDFTQIFERDAPVVVEIGFGNGETFCQMAQNEPDKSFIGIEVYRSGVAQVLSTCEREGISNVRVFCTDAIDVLQNCFSSESILRLQIYFPDPWHKSRHHKRRLIQPSFLDLIAPKFVANGQCHLATDWENYAEHMMEVFSQHPLFSNVFGEGKYSPDALNRPETKFQRRGQRLGHGVWDMLFEKQSS